jgi:MFS family permease
VYYISYVFGMAGYSGNANLLASSIQYVINVLMTVPALIWVDRWGRRPTLLIGAIFMALWMYANAGIMATYGTVVPGGINGTPEESMSLSGPPAKALIACTYLFVASYAPSWGPVSWIYPPELFPLRLRGKGVAFATSSNWAFNLALGLFTPPAFETIMWKTYLIFGVFCTVMFVHVFFLFPETSGKTLEETEAMFEDPSGPKYIGIPAWKTQNFIKRTVAMEKGDIESKHAIIHREEAEAAATVTADPKTG